MTIVDLHDDMCIHISVYMHAMSVSLCIRMSVPTHIYGR